MRPHFAWPLEPAPILGVDPPAHCHPPRSHSSSPRPGPTGAASGAASVRRLEERRGWEVVTPLPLPSFYSATGFAVAAVQPLLIFRQRRCPWTRKPLQGTCHTAPAGE